MLFYSNNGCKDKKRISDKNVVNSPDNNRSSAKHFKNISSQFKSILKLPHIVFYFIRYIQITIYFYCIERVKYNIE